MLLDPETWDLVQHVDSVLAARRRRGAFEAHINPGADAVGRRDHDTGLPTAGEVERHLRTAAPVRRGDRAQRRAAASPRRARTLSASSSASGSPAKDRYRALVDQLQYIARQQLIFGMHVHVAVDDPDKAIQVVDGLLVHLPESARALGELAVLARRADRSCSRRGRWSSPRSRARVCRRASRATRTSPQLVGQLERTGCIADYTHIWWDIRPHPRLGTVELRICDAVTRVEDAVALAAYFQALVKMLCEQVENGREGAELPPHPHDREQVARRALRARRRP